MVKIMAKDYRNELSSQEIAALPVRNPRRKSYIPYELAKEAIRRENPEIKTSTNYRKWVRESKSDYLPLYPENIYPNFSWMDYLDTEYKSFALTVVKNRARGKIKYRNMWDAIRWAQKYCKENNIRTMNEWRNHCKDNDLPKDIPKVPENKYSEFPGYPVWLGKKVSGIISMHENITPILTLNHVPNQPLNVVSIRIWKNGIHEVKEKRKEFGKTYGIWEHEQELMSQVMDILAQFGTNNDGIYVISNMNALLWELNSILLMINDR